MIQDKTNNESGYRAKIILLKGEGYTIHRINEHGIEGITSKIYKYKPTKITPEIEKKIVEIATKNPRKGMDYPFQHGH
jgi:hypothetical protein